MQNNAPNGQQLSVSQMVDNASPPILSERSESKDARGKRIHDRLKAFFSRRRDLLLFAAWFVVLSGLPLAAITARYLRHAVGIESAGVYAYLAAAFIGQVALAIWLPYVLILVPLVLAVPSRRLVAIVASVLMVAGSFVLLVDTFVYDRYRGHLSGMIIGLLIEGGSEMFNFAATLWIAAGVIAVVLVAIAVGFVFLARRLTARRSGRVVRAAAILSLTAFATAACVHIVADAKSYRPITSLTRHLAAYQLATAKRFLHRLGVHLSDAGQRADMARAGGGTGNVRYPLAPMTCPGEGRPYNLLVVLIDCWRFDMLTDEVTPQMARFAAEKPTIRFTDHWSGGNATRIGVFSLFYGLVGTYWDSIYADQVGPVLIHELLRRQYQFGVFASARLSAPPFDRTVFVEYPSLRPDTPGEEAYIRDRVITSEWKTWLASTERSKPFFGFLFYDTPHSFAVPPDYPRLFGEIGRPGQTHPIVGQRDPAPVLNSYKLTLHYTDALVGEVLADLEQRGLLDNTIVVLTGDHGEEFDENGNGYWGHGGNYTRHQLGVPLVISWPGRGASRVTYRTTHLDVAPTLMHDMLGCENPPSDFSSGRNLFDPADRPWLLAGGYFNYGIVEADRTTVSFPTGGYEIMDLKAGELQGAELRGATIQAALAEMARFH